MFRALDRACVVLAIGCCLITASSAQEGVTVGGQIVNSLSGDAVADVTVVLEELARETPAASDGTFVFEDVPPGSYHISVRADGFSERRTEVAVGADGLTQTVLVDPEIHYSEVVSVSPEPRSPFESYQPTAVLAGQELTKQLESSLGATLQNEPGVSSRSFGQAPSRPVIRGLDGDRVLILQDGQRTGDLSSQSGDHGVAVNPAAAQRIEVVRGPATLLYGANAIGGLVNVITEEIPTQPLTGVTGTFTVDGGTAAAEGGAAGELRWGTGRFALQVGGAGRRSGSYSTPAGTVDNSQARSGLGTVGGAWTGSTGYVGGSYGYDDMKYGIPLIEGGEIQLTPSRHAINVKAGANQVGGLIESVRVQVAIRRYTHTEFEGDEAGTRFFNDTNEAEVMTSHRPVGQLKGSLGLSVLSRAFDAQGAEALSPAIDERGFAAFAYEELTWPHLTFQFGGRIQQTHYRPVGEPDRTFTSGSGSIGLLVRPASAHDAFTIAASLARAARNPALEELFYLGAHPGNFAFEVGNPSLRPEHALGVDLSLRWRTGRASGEFTYFRNQVSDFIFRKELTPEAFDAREEEWKERFPGRVQGHTGEDGEDGDTGGGLPFIEYVAADSSLQGIEAHSDVQITQSLVAEVGFDYVQGSLDDTGTPLPRIPPLRFRGGLRYRYNAFQAGGDMIVVATQERVNGTERPTDGYKLLRLFGAYSRQTRGAVSTLTARLDNATNRLYRNHLSLIKEFAPEIGRSFRLLYSVQF